MAGAVNYPHDPIVAAMRAAHRAGASIYAIARAVGMGWQTVRKIVKGEQK